MEWCSWRKVGGDVGGKADGGFVELEDGTKGGDVGGGAEWSSARIWDWEFEKSESENDKWEKWKPKREDEKNQKFNQARVNGGSNYDSLKVAKCLVI